MGRASLFLLFTAMTAGIVVLALRLRDEQGPLDEELGPAGTLADDELRGPALARAVRAAFTETGIGKVVSVERDTGHGIEVRVRTGSRRQIEVELDRNYRVIEVDDESLGDE